MEGIILQPYLMLHHDSIVLWIRSLIARILKIFKQCFGFCPAYGRDVWDFINDLKCKNDISVQRTGNSIFTLIILLMVVFFNSMYRR